LNTNTRLFIKNINPNINKEGLTEYFKQFGDPIDFKVEININKKKHRGFGFIDVYKQHMFEKIMARSHRLFGQKLHIEKAKDQDEIKANERILLENPRKIFCGGIPQNTTTEELLAYFKKYGDIEDITLDFKRKNKGKGFCFLLFKNCESMKKVLADYNEHYIHGEWFEVLESKPKFHENRKILEKEIEKDIFNDENKFVENILNIKLNKKAIESSKNVPKSYSKKSSKKISFETLTSSQFMEENSTRKSSLFGLGNSLNFTDSESSAKKILSIKTNIKEDKPLKDNCSRASSVDTSHS